MSMKTTLAMLLLISEAFVGQVHPKQITLQALVDKSDCIFVVQKATPYSRVEDIPLDESGKYPPHQSPWYRYKIIEIIKDEPETKPAPGSEIEALGAHDASLLLVDRKHALEGDSKSPILDFYEPRTEQVEKRDTFIVFLTWNEEEKRYAIAADGAYETKDLKQEIKYLTGKTLRAGRP
ncbi:MAG: hypothetical protein ABIW76_20095 [Fibrobacteria bacterium]